MKKLILTSIVALLPIVGNAGVLAITKDSGQISESVKSGSGTDINPTRFYISIKGGNNSLSGTFGGDSDNVDSGIDFDGASTGVFTGSIGFDLGTPRVRWEFELSKVSAGDIEFAEPYTDLLHGNIGYTSYMINFIPYFRINNTSSVLLTLGLGGASVDFTDTDDADAFNLKSSGGFAVNLGLGLDIKLSDHFSIIPEFKYNGIIASTTYKNMYVTGTDNLYISNFQALLGMRLTF